MNIKINAADLDSADYPTHINLNDVANAFTVIVNNFPFKDDNYKEDAKGLLLNSSFYMQTSMNGKLGWPAIDDVGSVITQKFAMHHAILTISDELKDSYVVTSDKAHDDHIKKLSIKSILSGVSLDPDTLRRGRLISQALSQTEKNVRDPRWTFSIYEGSTKIEVGSNDFEGIPEIYAELQSLKLADGVTNGMIIVDRHSPSAESQAAVYFSESEKLQQLPIKMAITNEDKLTEVAQSYINNQVKKELTKESTSEMTI